MSNATQNTVSPPAASGVPADRRAVTPVRLAVVALLAFVWGGLVGLLTFPAALDGLLAPPAPPRADIGGPFSLVDQTGRTVTEANFRGRYMLIAFGSTSSPDVTPATLQLMTAALDGLGQASARIVPVLVTLDPLRDRPDRLKRYLSRFSPMLIGLTGNPEQISAVAREWRVITGTLSNSDHNEQLTDEPAYIYLMGPDGNYIAHFSMTTDLKSMRRRLSRELR